MSRVVLRSVAAFAALPLAAGELSVNQWARLPAKAELGYSCSQPIYAPSRGQVLHWGAVGGGKGGRNDVRAFEAAVGDWVSDYPSTAADLMISGGGSGSALSWTGMGQMRPDGTPKPAGIVNGVCWDSKRERLVYTMAGLMVAYDPKEKKWSDLKAKTILDGKELPGGPPVYGVGTGYDPVNDEIVMFPHFGGYNLDRVEVDGQISCHYGTFRYRFADNTWRRVGDTLGTDEVRKARAAVLALVGRVSRASDSAWALRKRADVAKPDEIRKAFAEAAAEAAKLQLPATAAEGFKKAAESLAAASKDAAAGKWDAAVAAAGAALWSLNEDILGRTLLVEPPPRCAAALVFDPKAKALVMFGGKTGGANGVFAMNDTWLYDCQTRQWRELACKNRPPVTTWNKYADMSDLVYDPASGLFLFVFRPRLWVNEDKNVVIWGLDVVKGEWKRLHEQPWTGNRAHNYNVALDESRKLLLVQPTDAGQETYALRLDVAAMTPAPAPEWKAPELKPVEIPAEDPAWVAKLKDLPANKWVHTKAANEPAARDWGNLAYDPVRDWVVYFGGGHSTYQGSDVAVYPVGANRWVTTMGEHNDRVPAAGWEGEGIGFRGSARAGHMRNAYVAVDGRMFVHVKRGITNGRDISPELQSRVGRNAWFCDLDRGGVWRMLKPAGVAPASADYAIIGTWLSTSDGRVLSPETRYDIHANRVTVVKAANAAPKPPAECRPYCFLPDKGAKGQVFYFDSRKTWTYDIETETWKDLAAKNAPTPGPKPREWATPNTVEYITGQDAVWAVIQTDWQVQAQWVYSFKRNAWAPLPMECDSPPCFATPYGQIVYAARHGVLVAVPKGGTAAMRPDVSQVKWE